MIGAGCLSPLGTWMVFRSTYSDPQWRHHEAPAAFLGIFPIYIVLIFLLFRKIQRLRFLEARQTKPAGTTSASPSPTAANPAGPEKPVMRELGEVVREIMELLGNLFSREKRPTPPSPEAATDLRRIRDQVRLPAVGLFLTGVVGVFGQLFIAHPYIDWFANKIIGYLTSLALSGLLIAAGSCMRKLRLYDFCLIASLLALVPLTFGYPLGLFVGLWALWVLRKPEVMAAFDRPPR
jgi:hypothetical protein